MNFLVAAAAAVCFVTFMVHWQVGGIFAARPLLAAKDITEGSRWLNYLCWHIVTMLLLILTVALGVGAAGRLSNDALILAAIISAGISFVSVLVTLRGGIHPLRFPSTYLPALVAALAFAGM